ncbi:MAG: tetratricopeptide repeat protein [Oligoflexia bacterium]|nr:tetratricopeptide repeat protein [Oligoflexia bacterium]
MKKYAYLFLFCLLVSCSTTGNVSKQSQNEKKGDIYLNAGTDALYAGNYTEALRSLIKATEYLKTSAAAWTNLGLAYAAKEQLDKAKDCWEKAIRFEPGYADAKFNLGSLALQQSRYIEAEKHFQDLSSNLMYEKQDQVHYQLALLYKKMGRRLQTEQQLRLATKTNSQNCKAWHDLGEVQEEKGDLRAALQSFQNSIKGLCFKNPKAHYEIGSLYVKFRDMPMARAKMLDIIQLFPESEWAKKAEITLNLIRE